MKSREYLAWMICLVLFAFLCIVANNNAKLRTKLNQSTQSEVVSNGSSQPVHSDNGASHSTGASQPAMPTGITKTRVIYRNRACAKAATIPLVSGRSGESVDEERLRELAKMADADKDAKELLASQVKALEAGQKLQ